MTGSGLVVVLEEPGGGQATECQHPLHQASRIELRRRGAGQGHRLPIGIQLVGRPYDELTLISLAAQLEQARPWLGRRPEIW